MIKPAFFVDGFMEKKILQKMNIKTKIIRTDLNGKNVEISAIAERIASNIRTIKGRYSPFIIVIDRERRKMSASKICKVLYENLKSKGIKDDLIIGVADRMTENWIIADWDNFNRYIGKNISKPTCSTEGKNGYKIIKNNYKHYQKTTDGVCLFCESKPSIIKTNSQSFKNLFEQINKFKSSCYWLNC